MSASENNDATNGGRRQSGLRRKFGVIASYVRRRPIWCTWQVTYRCNFRCDMCSYWSTPHDKPEQSLAAFETGSHKLADGIGNLMISLAGGEPLLRDDIVDIVGILSARHLPMVTTNGWLATKEKARAMWQAGLYGVSVSLDFANADRHDKGRGVKGAFDRAVQALDHFSSTREKSRQKVNLMTVLRHDNLDEIESLIKLAAENHAYFMLQPYCEMKTGDTKFTPARDAATKLLELKKLYPNFLSNTEFIRRFPQAAESEVPGCVAGRSFFNIDTNGDISRCVEFRNQPIANLARDDVVEIMRRLRKAHRTNDCNACWYNCRGEIEVMYTARGVLDAIPKLLNG